MKAVPTYLGVTLVAVEDIRHRRLLMPFRHLPCHVSKTSLCFDAVSVGSAISMIWFAWFIFWTNYHCDLASCPCFFSVSLALGSIMLFGCSEFL